MNAILLLGASVVLFLSFVSFVPGDISWVKEPPNSPAQNFVGPLGAWVAYLLALPFGNSVWLLFALALGFGIAFLFAGEQMGWRQVYWTALMLLSGCGLADKLQIASDSTLAQCGHGAGGFLGQFIAGTLLAPVAPAGPYIILPTVWLVSVVMLTGFRPIHTGALLLMKLQEAWAVKREQSSAASRPDLRGELVRKQRDVERQMRDLEKNGKRAAAEEEEPEPVEQVLPPQNITIRDHSQPTPTVKQATIPTATPAGEKAAAKALATAAAAPPLVMPMFEPLPEPKPAPKPAPKPKAEPPPPPPKKVEPQEALAVSAPEPDLPAASPPVAPPKPAAPAAPLRPPASRKPAAAPPAAPVSYKNWQLPSHDLLVRPAQDSPAAQVVEDLKQSAAVLQATLADFGLDVRIGEVTKGPVITRYEIHPAPGVKVERITTLHNNIALAMRATSVRIIAPIPGKAAVGIEVPNHTTTMVFLRDVLESDAWKNSKARLPLALGKDIGGNVIIGDLADMPHLLVAGATGSGKTVCINAVITGLLFRMSPEELKFVFVDPKIVEMQMFSALPHLALPIVTDAKKVLLALRWLITEMERRYQIFAKAGVRNIHGFNTRDRKRDPKPEPVEKPNGEQMELSVPRDFELKIPDKLPYIVFVVDELADLMMTAPADVEMAITRLAQLARATGIHMILATQRPSVDVITGVIKANVPARIAFQVASKQDSRVILDANGADKLLGKGDMLYLPPGSARLVRAQGVYVQDEEIRLVAECLAKQAPPSFERGITEKLTAETPAGSMNGEGEEDEELVEQCVEVIRQSKRASVSILQRRLRIGYTRAARIMDILEERGIVGPHKGAEPRDILIDLDGEIPSNNEN
ncbi:MAG: DNA translocase FtsK [Verrucomicrobia bacterium]|nr:DNA translocase FtsK [Verrucomicrobiota bacterium]